MGMDNEIISINDFVAHVEEDILDKDGMEDGGGKDKEAD